MVRSTLSDVTIPSTPIWKLVLEGADGLEYSNRTALICCENGKETTYGELVRKCQAVATGLKKHGLKHGDVVALFLPNCPEYAWMVFGTIMAGGIVCPVNQGFTQYELQRQLLDSGARFIVTSSDLDPKVAATQRGDERLKDIQCIVLDDSELPHRISDANHVVRADDLVTFGFQSTFVEVPCHPTEDVAFILYSSGTTGKPKGVMLTHHNVVANVKQLGHPELYLPVQPTSSDTAEVTLGWLPFSHIYGLMTFLMRALYQKYTVVVMAKYTPRAFLQAIATHRVTGLALVPPVLLMLANDPIATSYDLSSVRRVNCSAAPTSSDVIERVRRRLDVPAITQAYGMTETSPGITAPVLPQTPGSSGVLLPNTELQIVRDRNVVDEGDVGEIWVRGPQVMKGYLNRPQETLVARDQQGWLHTGDLGYLNKKGELFIVDRMKELIKYKGYQVSPAEIESVLLTHPDISDAAVIGRPDHVAGELPKAFIVCRQGATLEADEVQSFIGDRLSNPKQLRGGVEFVKSIPKSPSGKIQRRQLVLAERQRVKSRL